MSDKFNLLKKLLKAIGLSDERVEELIAWIETWLQDDREEEGASEEEPQAERYPYRLQDRFLSAAELHFYQSLLPAVDSWAIVCPKVRLGDLVYDYTAGNRRWTAAGNRINQKHVDFLLCDPRTMQPLLGVELNDRSHERERRKKRDRFVVGVFDAVGLPLVGIRQRPEYNVEELARFLRMKASTGRESSAFRPQNDGKPVSVEVSEPVTVAPPSCPKCGATMVQRVAKSGANEGKPFWGCPNSPRCRGVLAFESAGRETI